MKNIIKFIALVICVFCVAYLIVVTMRDGQAYRKIKLELEMAKHVEQEAVKHGAGKYVSDSNGAPVFVWITMPVKD